jgi:molybdopterin converting factor small subunit
MWNALNRYAQQSIRIHPRFNDKPRTCVDRLARLRYVLGLPEHTSMEAAIPQIRVAIPHQLRSLCGGGARSPAGEIHLCASDVRSLLGELARRHPEVHVRVCDERGDPRPHINVFVNDDHVRQRDGLDTPLAAGDLVTILPAVSGG